MTGVVSSQPAVRHDPATGRDAVIAAVLLAVALLPVYTGRASLPGSPAASAAVRMHVAWETHTRRAIAAGELPLWNPYNAAGRLHVADAQTQALYPPHVLLRFLPIGVFFVVSFVLHGWIFGFGAYAAARVLGAPRIAACAAAVGVMLLGILAPAGSSGYTPSLYSIAWLPLLLALALRASTQSPLLPPLPLAMVAALAFTAGGRSAAYAIGALSASYLLALSGERGASARPTLLRLGAVLVIAAGLAAFQLLPGVRMQTAAAWTGGARASDLAESGPADPGAASEDGARDHVLATPTTAVFTSLAMRGGPRVISTCRAADASEMLRLGVPSLYTGGVSTRDYDRLISLAAGRADGRADALDLERPSTRRDLLGLLHVGAYVACGEAAGRDNPASEVRPVRMTRIQPLPRAFWTCTPRRVGREELDYRLQNYRYDDTLTLYPANPVVNVRWTADLDEAARAAAEAELRMRPRRPLEDRTGQYDLIDASRTNLAAIVRHPLVEDTAGFDRGSLELPPAPPAPAFDERQSEWLLGVDRCDELRPATIARMDAADGAFVATVDAPRDGVVFVADAYHPDRTAWVDGSRVDALRTNLALTAIPVTAGRHRIELRSDLSAVSVGFGLSLLTLAAWIAAARVPRR